ncbi:hypothetical protein [Streptomyces sp. NPDC001500]
MGRPAHRVVLAPDGPLPGIAGPARALLTAPREPGPSGDELDAPIARQRDFFGARGEAVEWRLRGHGLPAGLPGRLHAAGFSPGPRESVLATVVARHARRAGPSLPKGVTPRRATAAVDLRTLTPMTPCVRTP